MLPRGNTGHQLLHTHTTHQRQGKHRPGKDKKIYSDRKKKLESGSAMFWLSGIWIEKIKCNYKILDPNRGSIIPQMVSHQSIMYTKLVSNNL